jgi:hypothetical protein
MPVKLKQRSGSHKKNNCAREAEKRGRAVTKKDNSAHGAENRGLAVTKKHNSACETEKRGRYKEK